MIYAIVDTKYGERGDDIHDLVTILEGDGNPEAIIFAARCASRADMDEWVKANPPPKWVSTPKGDDEAMWVEHGMSQARWARHNAARAEEQKRLDTIHGGNALEILLKAGFKIIECKRVSL